MGRTLKFVDNKNQEILAFTLGFRLVSDIALHFLENQLEYLDMRSDLPKNKRRGSGSTIVAAKQQFTLENFYPHVTVGRTFCQIKLQESLSQDEFVTLGYWNYINDVLISFGVVVSDLSKQQCPQE